MLLIELSITRACTKNTNIAEVAEVAKKRIQLSNNQWETRPIWGGVYTLGLPLGESSLPCETPIDLHTGDLVRVVDDFPNRMVFDITRSGKVVWQDAELAAIDKQKAADKAAKYAALKAVGR